MQFNSTLQKYGYEDLGFSMNLKSAKIPVLHIDNPIYNNDIEVGEVYLKKVEESVDSLSFLLKDNDISDRLSDIKLVKAYRYVIQKGLQSPFIILFSFSEKIVKKNLLSERPNLRGLDLYKLGLLLKRRK